MAHHAATSYHLLLDAVNAKSKQAEHSALRAIIEHLRGPESSIVDIHSAIDRVATEAAEAGKLELASRMLTKVHKRSIEIAETHEKVIEGTSCGFCETDGAGIIRYANPALEALLPQCRGTRLSSYFGTNAAQISAALRGQRETLTGHMSIAHADKTLSVSVEIGHLVLAAKRIGYAFIVNISRYVEVERRAYDASPFGILDFGLDRRVRFANKKACKLFGLKREALVGKHVHSLFSGPGSRKAIDEVGKQIDRLRGDKRMLHVRDATRNLLLPVEVNVRPKIDVEGRKSGSIAVLIPREREQSRSNIHAACASCWTVAGIIDAACVEIQRYMPFNAIALTIYTEDGEYGRVIHSKTEYPRPATTRWYKLGKFLQKKICRPHVGSSLKEWRAALPDSEPSKHDEASKAAEDVYGGLLIYPVADGDRLIASLSLLAAERDVYTARHLEILHEIDVNRAVHAAIDLHHRGGKEFLLDLLKRLPEATTTLNLAQILVDHLCEQYHWENISVFKVDHIDNEFQLIAQCAGPVDGFTLRANYCQPLHIGILGQALKKKSSVMLLDTNDARDPLSKHFVRVSDDHPTRSELVVPVSLDDEIYWLLNLESKQKNGFARPEIDTLQRLIGDVERTLERLFSSAINAQIFETASQGIIFVDYFGVIRKANAAARALLDLRPVQKASPVRFSDLIANEADRLLVLSGQRVDLHSINMLTPKGRAVPVLLTMLSRVEQYDCRVFVLRSVRQRDWQIELSAVTSAIAEVAQQTRAPLGLATTMVQRINRYISDEAAKDTVGDIVRSAVGYLDKVDLSYRRVIESLDKKKGERQAVAPISIERLIRDTIAALPNDERKVLRLSIETPVDTIQGDFGKLQFVFRTLLDYLLRTADDDDVVGIKVRSDDSACTIEVKGRPRPISAQSDPISSATLDIRKELSFGESAVKRIIEDHRGTISLSESGGDHFEAQIQLPVSRPERGP